LRQRFAIADLAELGDAAHAALWLGFFPLAFNVFFSTEIRNMPSAATDPLTVK
jgi:hypothetical protein